MAAPQAIGFLEPVAQASDGSYRITGWACALGQTQSANVQLFAGGAMGIGASIGVFTANQSSEPAVANACQSTGKAYRFTISLTPAILQNFGGKLIYGEAEAANATSGAIYQSGLYTVPKTQSTGFIDGVFLSNNDYVVGGWACALTKPNSINVELFSGGAMGSGTSMGVYTANLASEPAVANVCQSTGKAYRFLIPLTPTILQNFAGKLIYGEAEAVDAASGAMNQSGIYSVPKSQNIGFIDGVFPSNGSYAVGGWACTLTKPNAINIELFVGGAKGAGTSIGVYTANLASEPAVANVCQSTGKAYRFIIPLTQTTLRQYGGKPIYGEAEATDAAPGAMAQSGAFDVPMIGQLERASLNFIRGWACPDPVTKKPVPVYVYATNVPNCTYVDNSLKTVSLCLVAVDKTPGSNMTAYGQSVNTNPAIASLPRESVVGEHCGGTSTVGFQLLTPPALLDGQNHQIFAFTTQSADTGHQLQGAPLTFNSHLLYQQEPILDLSWNAAIQYTQQLSPSDNTLLPFPSGVHAQYVTFLNATASSDFSATFEDRTSILYWTEPANPLGAGAAATQLNANLSNVTGLDVPGATNQQLGFVDAAGRVNALQASDTSIGMSTALRAISPARWETSPVIVYSYESNRAPSPFAKGGGVQVNGYIKRPSLSLPENPAAPDSATYGRGLEGYYYVLTFFNKNCATGMSCPQVWYAANLFTTPQLGPTAVGNDAIDNMQDQVSGDASNVYPGPLLAPGSNWLTPCAGSAAYYAGLSPDAQERPYCFTVNSAQFQNMLQATNAKLKLKMSTNPADYVLSSFIFDTENWLPWPQNDPRMGFALRDVTIQQF